MADHLSRPEPAVLVQRQPTPQRPMSRDVQLATTSDGASTQSQRSVASFKSWLEPLRLRGGCTGACGCEDPRQAERRRNDPLPQSPHWRTAGNALEPTHTRNSTMNQSLRLAISKSIEPQSASGAAGAGGGLGLGTVVGGAEEEGSDSPPYRDETGFTGRASPA